MEGLKNRVGQVWLPNKTMRNPLVHLLCGAVAEKVETQGSDKERHFWIVFQTYSACVYVVSLKRSEDFLLDLNGLQNYWTSDDSDHIVMSLL